jgi:hypothetical protein
MRIPRAICSIENFKSTAYLPKVLFHGVCIAVLHLWWPAMAGDGNDESATASSELIQPAILADSALTNQELVMHYQRKGESRNYGSLTNTADSNDDVPTNNSWTSTRDLGG